jgi:hypothetical protein
MSAPDADRPTIHVRCGSDIRGRLVEAGFNGTFLEMSDPLVQGPVIAGPGYVAIRARFIAQAYELPPSDTAMRLQAEYAAFDMAIRSGDRIVLWFEHDSYDQLILARLLDALAGRPDVELICIDRHPDFPPAGPGRFTGLGQLSADQLHALWPARRPVMRADTDLGQAVWRALCNPSPAALFSIADRGTPAIPPMAKALLRHLQELPWTSDGLSCCERLVLSAIASGAATVGQTFAAYQGNEPLPFLGDLMILPIIAGLATAGAPAIHVGPDDRWQERSVSLTADGRAVLDQAVEWQSMQPPERWVGGVHVNAAGWRWDLNLNRLTGYDGEPVRFP